MILPLLIPALIAGSAAGPGLGAADLVLLFEIGVSEQEIMAFADRKGGFEPLDSETCAAVESLGASRGFLERLPRSAPDFGEISALARASDVFEDAKLKLSFVYPAGWAVSRGGTDGANAAIVLRVAPRSSNDPRVFVTPCIFLFLQNESGLVPEAAGPALGEIRQIMLHKLRTAGLRPVSASSEPTAFLGGACETVRLEAPIDGGAVGVLELALIVDSKGRAAGVGFTAGAGDRAATAEAFVRLARSVVLR